MLKKLELSTPTSCLNRAAADEPLFVLRAHDELATQAILHWCHLYRKKHTSPSGVWDSEARRQKHNEALACAELFDRWAEQHPDDVPSDTQPLAPT